MVNNNYYEGILQIRDCDETVYEYVERRLDEQQVGVAKVVHQKNGDDYYLDSNSFLRKIGQELQKNFTGELQVSNKLFSRDQQTGKELYRMTTCFRQLPFQIGEEIEYEGEKYRIMRISGGNITIKNLKTGKSKFMKR